MAWLSPVRPELMFLQVADWLLNGRLCAATKAASTEHVSKSPREKAPPASAADYASALAR